MFWKIERGSRVFSSVSDIEIGSIDWYIDKISSSTDNAKRMRVEVSKMEIERWRVKVRMEQLESALANRWQSAKSWWTNSYGNVTRVECDELDSMLKGFCHH